MKTKISLIVRAFMCNARTVIIGYEKCIASWKERDIGYQARQDNQRALDRSISIGFNCFGKRKQRCFSVTMQ